MSPYRDDDNYGRRYSGFQEGYTSADNRPQRKRQEERTPERKNEDGARSRFIDTGDRYTTGYSLPEKADSVPRQPETAPEPELPVEEPFPERNDGLPYDEIYAPGHSKSMFGDYSLHGEDEDQAEAAAKEYYAARTGRDDATPVRKERPAVQRPENHQRTYRAENSDPAPAQGFSLQKVLDSIRGWFENLDGRTITYIFGGAVAVVAVILGISIATRSSCDSCGKPAEIPVIEQGDGLEGGTEPTYLPETVSTSDGIIIIDEDIPTDTFEVTVTDADGRYKRTNVYRAEEATLDITGQDQFGFTFSLEASAEGTSGTVAGQAYFCGESEAIYEASTGTLNFRFGSGGITVYMTDTFDAFNGAAPDGIYVSGEPTYIEDVAAQSEETGLDANVRNTEAVQSALLSLLPEQDISLMNSILSNGTERVFENSEKGYDRNGTPVNIDSQLNAVKYFSFVSGSGEELVMICTNDGMVYVGLCDGAEYRYYTNDPAYASEAPRAIAGQAAGKGMTLKY